MLSTTWWQNKIYCIYLRISVHIPGYSWLLAMVTWNHALFAGFDTGAAEQPSARSGGVAAVDSSFSVAEGGRWSPVKPGCTLSHWVGGHGFIWWYLDQQGQVAKQIYKWCNICLDGFWMFVDYLVGGLELVFFHTLGIITPTDFHVFQRGWNHQPVIIHAFFWRLSTLGLTGNHAPGNSGVLFFARPSFRRFTPIDRYIKL